MDKKAQGISINFIVIAAIAALVLVIVIAFTTGGLGTSLKQIFRSGQSDTQAIITTCDTHCNQAKLISSPNQWTNTDYCKKTFDVDFDGDGDINVEADSNEKALHCWSPGLDVRCSQTLNGYTLDVDVEGNTCRKIDPV
jgi:hypothetical protein